MHSKARASILPAGLSALAQQSVLRPLSPRPASLLLSGLPKQSSKSLLRTHNACPAHCSHCFCSLPTQLLPDWGFCRAISSDGSFWLLSLICWRLPWLPLFHGLTPIVLFFSLLCLFVCTCTWVGMHVMWSVHMELREQLLESVFSSHHMDSGD